MSFSGTGWIRKPVAIEAIQVPAPDVLPSEELIDLVQDQGWDFDGEKIIIKTCVGLMVAHPADWIIKDEDGDFFPCRPDDFRTEYDAAGT